MSRSPIPAPEMWGLLQAAGIIVEPANPAGLGWVYKVPGVADQPTDFYDTPGQALAKALERIVTEARHRIAEHTAAAATDTSADSRGFYRTCHRAGTLFWPETPDTPDFPIKLDAPTINQHIQRGKKLWVRGDGYWTRIEKARRRNGVIEVIAGGGWDELDPQQLFVGDTPPPIPERKRTTDFLDRMSD